MAIAHNSPHNPPLFTAVLRGGFFMSEPAQNGSVPDCRSGPSDVILRRKSASDTHHLYICGGLWVNVGRCGEIPLCEVDG